MDPGVQSFSVLNSSASWRVFHFNADGIAFSTVCFCPSGSNLLAILCILRQEKRKNLCSLVFLYTQGNLKGPICHFRCVSLRHKVELFNSLGWKGP